MDRHDIARCALASLGTVEWNLSPAGNRFAVVDDFFPSELARALARAFVPESARVRGTFRERTSRFIDSRPRLLAEACHALHSAGLVARIEDLFGERGLEADPSVYAGGLSLKARGDFLNPHIDNSHDRHRRLYRRLNLLYYCTPGWETEDGGHLELWDRSVRQAHVIESRFNRFVIMETSPTSWHSVSPVKGDRVRRCFAAHLFSRRSPTGAEYYHVTRFTGRPGQVWQRAIAPLDNGLRLLARQMGAKRQTDSRGHAALAM